MCINICLYATVAVVDFGNKLRSVFTLIVGKSQVGLCRFSYAVWGFMNIDGIPRYSLICIVLIAKGGIIFLLANNKLLLVSTADWKAGFLGLALHL